MEHKGFKSKTIKHVIENKINHWLKSIDDEEIKNIIIQNYILTGGAIVSLLQGEMPNDYDIYFRDIEAAKRVAGYYISKLSSDNDKVKIKIDDNATDGVKIIIKSAGIAQGEADRQQDYGYFEMDGDPVGNIESYLDKEAIKSKEKYKLAMVTSNAISLTGDVQLIFRFVGDPAKIHKNYDFVHTTNYYTSNEGLVLNVKAMEAIMSKTLTYVGSLYPICSLFRLRKFINRGWSINAGEILKIAFDVNKLKLDDMNVLYDQLVGVDAAYFHQLIGMLKEYKKNNEGVDLDRSYFFQLINKVFDDAEPSLQDDDGDALTVESE